MSGYRNKQPVHVKELLNNDVSSAQSVFSHIESLQLLESCLEQFLDTELFQHCRVANFRNETLTLNTSSASWATRIRYSVPDILNAIGNNQFPVNVKSIRVIVVPEQSFNSSPWTERPELSQETADILIKIAESIDDESLSNCIKRLCRHSSVKL